MTRSMASTNDGVKAWQEYADAVTTARVNAAMPKIQEYRRKLGEERSGNE